MFSKLGHGSKEFLVIRICAVLILFYTLYLASFVLFAEEVNFNRWSAFFENPVNKILTSLFFLAFFFVAYDEKAVFLKLIKTQLFLHLFGLLKKYVQKSVRGEYFLQQIMNGAFSASLLF